MHTFFCVPGLKINAETQRTQRAAKKDFPSAFLRVLCVFAFVGCHKIRVYPWLKTKNPPPFGSGFDKFW